jgi:hypothetical protein
MQRATNKAAQERMLNPDDPNLKMVNLGASIPTTLTEGVTSGNSPLFFPEGGNVQSPIGMSPADDAHEMGIVTMSTEATKTTEIPNLTRTLLTNPKSTTSLAPASSREQKAPTDVTCSSPKSSEAAPTSQTGIISALSTLVGPLGQSSALSIGASTAPTSAQVPTAPFKGLLDLGAVTINTTGRRAWRDTEVDFAINFDGHTVGDILVDNLDPNDVRDLKAWNGNPDRIGLWFTDVNTHSLENLKKEAQKYFPTPSAHLGYVLPSPESANACRSLSVDHLQEHDVTAVFRSAGDRIAVLLFSCRRSSYWRSHPHFRQVPSNIDLIIEVRRCTEPGPSPIINEPLPVSKLLPHALEKRAGLCPFFRTPRGCSKGDMCSHIHSGAPEQAPRPHAGLCAFFRTPKGCIKGDMCSHIHSVEPKITTVSGTLAQSRVTGSPLTGRRKSLPEAGPLLQVARTGAVSDTDIKDARPQPTRSKSHAGIIEVFRHEPEADHKSAASVSNKTVRSQRSDLGKIDQRCSPVLEGIKSFSNPVRASTSSQKSESTAITNHPEAGRTAPESSSIVKAEEVDLDWTPDHGFKQLVEPLLERHEAAEIYVYISFSKEHPKQAEALRKWAAEHTTKRSVFNDDEWQDFLKVKAEVPKLLLFLEGSNAFDSLHSFTDIVFRSGTICHSVSWKIRGMTGSVAYEFSPLFPGGNFYLLTEKVLLKHPKMAADFLTWFQDMLKAKPQSRDKIMVRPSVQRHIEEVLKAEHMGANSRLQDLYTILETIRGLSPICDITVPGTTARMADPLGLQKRPAPFASFPLLPGEYTDEPDLERRDAWLLQHYVGESIRAASSYRRFTVLHCGNMQKGDFSEHISFRSIKGFLSQVLPKRADAPPR